ncbi:MAG: DMT family transporter [Peptococcaceae bacterium]|nr:DMT family transporter [Peptococcaceae bacterium]
MSIFRTRLARVGMTRRSANLLLVCITMAWGLSYVLLKIAGATLPPLEVLALRFTFATLACLLIFRRRLARANRRTLRYGIILGFVSFFCCAALIYGTRITEASTAAFLTSTAIVIVPVVQAFRHRRLPEPMVIFCTILATIGIALLSLKGGLTLSAGAVLCIIGAILYAAIIILTDEFVRLEDGILLGTIELAAMAVIAWIATLCTTTPVLPQTGAEWGAIFGLAFICSAFAFVAQPFAQSFTTPEHTALIFSMEPVWGAIYAYLLLGEVLSFQATCGALLVLASVLITSCWKPKPPHS